MRLLLTRFVMICVFARVTVTAQAQMQMNVDQLVQTVRSSTALRHDDKKVADYLKKVTLTDKLSDKTIQDLMAQGAGPKTIKALQDLRDKSASLKPPLADPTYSPGTAVEKETSGDTGTRLGPKPSFPAPNSVHQEEILDQVKQYAMSYTQNLPNFVCTQVTRRYVDPRSTGMFRLIDKINEQLSYSDGHENYKVVSVNDHVVNWTKEQIGGRGGTVSSGEFGSLMREVFEKHSQAEFNWDHWGNLRGKKLAVFNYFIDSGHSSYSIEDVSSEQRIITAYRGLVYADEFTGIVSRITFQAVDIPKTFPVQEASERLDYDEVTISGRPYIVPLIALVQLRAGQQKTKNEIEFRLYRKFGTEIVLDYSTPDPLPANKTAEQPGPGGESSAPLPPPTSLH